MTSTTLVGGKSTQIPFIIRVVEGYNLQRPDLATPPDPFVEVQTKGWRLLQGHQTQRTKTIQTNQNPTWGEEFILYPKSPDTDVIVIKVWDKEPTLVPDKLLGKAYLPVAQYLNVGPVDQWIPLVFGKKVTLMGRPAPAGQLHIIANYGASAIAQLQQQQQQYMPTTVEGPAKATAAPVPSSSTFTSMPTAQPASYSTVPISSTTTTMQGTALPPGYVTPGVQAISPSFISSTSGGMAHQAASGTSAFGAEPAKYVVETTIRMPPTQTM